MESKRSLRVALLQPAEPFGKNALLPLSLIGLAAILKEADISVDIIDARLHGLSVENTINLLEKLNPDVLGVTGLNTSYRYIKDLCIQLKRSCPNTPIMAGGYFIMSQPELILPRVPIDVACIGEGDEIVVDLVRRLANSENLDGLNNIAYMRGNEVVKSEIKLVENLDLMPFPAYDLLDMESYLGPKNVLDQPYQDFFMISTGRGCVFHCYYCGNPCNVVRRPSVSRLLEHMDLVNQRYGVRSFLFCEENAFYPHDWIIDFCKAVSASDRDYSFYFSGCANHVDEEIARAISSVNCAGAMVAVEHWNPEIQKNFFRARQSAHIIKAWDLFKKYGIRNHGFNILWGHPADTEESFVKSYKKSIQMMHEYDIDEISMAALVVYPNSRLKEDALKMKKIVDFEDFMYSQVGFGPYVNLTSEDDNCFRSFIRTRQLWETVTTSIDEFNSLVFGGKLFSSSNKDPLVTNPSVDTMPELLKRLFIKLCGSLGIFSPVKLISKTCISLVELALIKVLLNMPFSWKKNFRGILDKALGASMYNPERRYYQEISCIKEILSLPKNSKVAALGTATNSVYNLNKLLNSIRQREIEFIGFIDRKETIEFFSNCSLPVAQMYSSAFRDNESGQRTMFGHPLIPLEGLQEINPDFLVILSNFCDRNFLAMIESQLPELKLIQVLPPTPDKSLERICSLSATILNKRFRIRRQKELTKA